jgi:phasin family protein
MMVQVTDQWVALSKSQLDMTLRVAEISAGSLEKLAEVQFKAAKAAFADTVKVGKQLSAVKDPTEAASLSSTLAQPAWEKVQAYAKSVYEVGATAQAELTTLLEEQVGEFNKNVVIALDGWVKSAPPGTEGAVSAMKSVIQSANAAYESLLKTTKHGVALAESNATVLAAPAGGRRKAA